VWCEEYEMLKEQAVDKEYQERLDSLRWRLMVLGSCYGHDRIVVDDYDLGDNMDLRVYEENEEGAYIDADDTLLNFSPLDRLTIEDIEPLLPHLEAYVNDHMNMWPCSFCSGSY
jgi:hypothetical protein